MDGSFVPNITFGPGVVRAIRPLVTVPLEVDLMIVSPERHLRAFIDAEVMTVSPGFGGQTFLHSQLVKIRRLRRLLDDLALDVPIGVDGGINPATAPLVVSAGVTSLVAGSSIYSERASVAANLAALRASMLS
jgi:ribulose-phosphate 3-epimerase